MKKKILIIEADNSLPDELAEMVEYLCNRGHEIRIIFNCYNRTEYLHETLRRWRPNAVCFMSSYVYLDKMKGLFELARRLTFSTELWDLNGKYLNTSIERLIPEDMKHLFTVHHFNVLEVVTGLYDAQTHTELITKNKKP